MVGAYNSYWVVGCPITAVVVSFDGGRAWLILPTSGGEGSILGTCSLMSNHS